MGQVGQHLGNSGATERKSNAFGSTFAFFQPHKSQTKMQKSYQANAPKDNRKIATTDNKRFERKAGKSLRLNILG